MKHLIYCLALLPLLSCNQTKPVVQENFIDSLFKNFSTSSIALTNEKDLEFWKSRVDTLPESFVNLQKYSLALAMRFHIYGNINDLKVADSIMHKIAAQYKEPGLLLSLAGYKMLQHRFKEAKTCIDTVVVMQADKYAAQMMLFDASFELGEILQASMILKKNYAPGDYAYNFRLSKQDHYQGELKKSIEHMMNAAQLSGSSAYLRTTALSNAADLYIHNGEFKKAADLYRQCIRFNSCDFHSIMGLGWIALVHDGNEKLATKIFSFAREKIKSPDPLFKLLQAAELTDTNATMKYAKEFVQQASKPVYSNMYNKYLIQLYTGILSDPKSALAIAQKEIKTRATPQTYAWLAWCLYKNGKETEAYNVYRNHVSGLPLEALEVYWIGKIMKGLGRSYDAQQYFKAAEKNKYDLGLAIKKELIANL